jgi:hypothetical protein
VPLDAIDPRLMVGVTGILLVLVVGITMVVRHRGDKAAVRRRRLRVKVDRSVVERGSGYRVQAKGLEPEMRLEGGPFLALGEADRERFLTGWQRVEGRFADHPKNAVMEADQLVSSLMQACGYPVSDFTPRAANASVDPLPLVEYYRSAHAIALRPGGDEPSADELRLAMIRYLSLFDELVEVRSSGGNGSVA